MGADKILDNFRKAEAQLEKAQDDARTFFKKKADKDKKEINSYRFDRDEKLSLSDCEEQLGQIGLGNWLTLEIRRRPEGATTKTTRSN